MSSCWYDIKMECISCVVQIQGDANQTTVAFTSLTLKKKCLQVYIYWWKH